MRHVRVKTSFSAAAQTSPIYTLPFLCSTHYIATNFSYVIASNKLLGVKYSVFLALKISIFTLKLLINSYWWCILHFCLHFVFLTVHFSSFCGSAVKCGRLDVVFRCFRCSCNGAWWQEFCQLCETSVATVGSSPSQFKGPLCTATNLRRHSAIIHGAINWRGGRAQFLHWQ